ncbi:hypothetical protein KR215_005780 [Drosophila sulfurigaster]|nr:hypothetical protein KR215_005780 [Drosophila sulfurigaster]
MNVSTDFKPVPTRAALALQKSANKTEFTALVFQEPQAAATTKTNTTGEGAEATTTNAKDTKTDNEFDMKRARHEVLNFAMANQRTSKNKRKMEIFQLIKLGAKPPKKAYKNYKDLKAERQRLQDIREQRKKFHQLGKNQAGAASVKCTTKTQRNQRDKKRAPVANIGQHYGKAETKLKKRN